MKKIHLYLFLCLFLGQSCTNDFEEINTNPTAPTAVQASFLLRQVIYDSGEQMSYEGFVAGNLLGQYFTQIDFNLFDRHSLTETQFGGNPWPILYTNLRDNELILQQAQSNPIDAVYEGPALILKAYFAAALTDIYGNIPYSNALGGLEGEIKPSYDEQIDIYNATAGILDNLDQGIAAIQAYNGVLGLEGDILFNGDLGSWIRFANSLKIKALMRVSAKQSVGAALQSIYDSGQFIATNDQNASFDFTNGQPNNFRMATLRDGDFNLFIMSETMEEILATWNDPRQSILFRPFGNDASGTQFNGLLNGPDASASSISVADYSLTGTIFREETARLDANFMTAWETHFFLAEAAEKGLLTANAQSLYEEGVRLSFEYWGAVLPSDYLTSANTAYGNNGADKINQIISQKWLSNIINGYEGWIEYRRTGFPVLKTIASSLNNNLIPIRMPYPTEEAALNAVNYNNAAAATNGNSVNAPVWWDE